MADRNQNSFDGVTSEFKAPSAEFESFLRALDPAARAMIKEADRIKEVARSAAQCAATVKQAKLAGLG